MTTLDKTQIDKLKDAIVRYSRDNPHSIKCYSVGDDIITQGESGDSLFLITRGTSSILIESEFGPKEVALRTINDIVGETGLLNRNTPRTATVRVVSHEATAIMVTRAEVFSLIAQDPSLTDTAVSLWDLGNARAIESHNVATGEFYVANRLVTASIGDIHNFSSVSNFVHGEFADTFLFEFIEASQDLSEDIGAIFEDQGDGFKVIFEGNDKIVGAVQFSLAIISEFKKMRKHWIEFDQNFDKLGLGIGTVSDFMSVRSREHSGFKRTRVISHSINIAAAVAKYKKRPSDTNVYIDENTYNSIKSIEKYKFNKDCVFFDKLSEEITMYEISQDDPISEYIPINQNDKNIEITLNSNNSARIETHQSDSFEIGEFVFLCHNSQDKPYVRHLNNVLKEGGIKTWLDEEQIAPGDMWQEELEKAIEQVMGCMIIVGDSGFGPWQDNERRIFINEFVSRGCKIIPVLIGDGDVVPELPLLLRQSMWVDLRLNEALGITRIIKAFQRSM